MKKEGLTSIAVIICYIGRLPEWFPLWLNSCEKNETIDFFVFSDQKLDIVSSNVKIIKTSLEELKMRFSHTLGFDCNLDAAYKLCDYKVIYGEAFSEYIHEYVFWGHCDMDMIFGDLRKFITEDILASHERIFEVGHLSLYRNCKKINQMYKRKGAMYPYEKVYREKHYCGFDEHTGITRIFAINHVATYNAVVCADIDPHYKMFYMMDEDTLDGNMNLYNFQHQIFSWEDGKTYQIYINQDDICKKEVSYIHFMRKYPQNAKECVSKKRYCVTYMRFLPLPLNISKEFILDNDYSTKGIKKTIEYIKGFLQNGRKAIKEGEIWLRIKLRWNRMKVINRVGTSMPIIISRYYKTKTRKNNDAFFT